MAKPPRRKRFQVHLSTAVLLMFAAGILIWANVGEEFVPKFAGNEHDPGFTARVFGWPLIAYINTWHVRPEFANAKMPNPYSSYWRGTVDALVALAILFAVWFVCERWIAWRAGRKKE